MKKLLFFWRDWKWIILIVAYVAGSILLTMNLVGRINGLHTQIALVKGQVEACATRNAALANLAFSAVTTDGIHWTNAEEKCRAQILSAYDAGRSSVVTPDGVRRTIRERQASGAFTGSVSEPGAR